MPFLVTWQRPGGREIERQEFPRLEDASEAAEARALAWANEHGPTIAKVRTDNGAVIETFVRGWCPMNQRRGATNRLLRQYFPKGTDLSVHSQERLNEVAGDMNHRPRKALDYETPAERFDACVAMNA